MERSDFNAEYNHFGYMILYKGKPIGGAGVKERRRRRPSDLLYNKQQAGVTINAILDGRILPHMKKAIDKINAS